MYINEVKNITSDIEPVEEYAGANVPIMHHCLTKYRRRIRQFFI